MAKEFFITLNASELNALMGIDPKIVAAYLFVKRNIDFNTGKTKHICYGALAVYLGNMDRTQAKRLVEKMLKAGLISATDTKQIYNLVFSAVTRNDTITTNITNKTNTTTTTNTGESSSSFDNSKFFIEGGGGEGFENTKKAAKEAIKNDGEGVGSQNSQKGLVEGLTMEGANLKKIAISRKWLFAGNSQSHRFYNSAADVFKKEGATAEQIEATFTEAEAMISQPRPLDLCNIQNKKHKQKEEQPSNKRRAAGRGDLVI